MRCERSSQKNDDPPGVTIPTRVKVDPPTVTPSPSHAAEQHSASTKPASGWLAGLGKTALIIGGLLGVGWYGHESHWSLPFMAAAHDDADEHAAEHAAEQKSIDVRQVANGELEFATAEAMSLIGLTTTSVRRQPIAEEVPAHGVISYDRKLLARLSPRAQGIIWRVEKHLGDTVRKGDVLAIIEAVPIGDAKAEFLGALAVAEVRVEQRQRLEGLPDVVSQQSLREASLSEREALVRLRNAEQTLINLGLPIRYQDYAELTDTERFRRLQFLGLPEPLTATVDPRTTTSNLFPLTAPFDGQVISRDVALGEVVQTDQTLFEIADTTRMWLQLDVGKEHANDLQPGQHVRFTADGVDDVIEAQIDWISTEVNENTRTVQVRAQVENALLADAPAGNMQRRLRANTFGTARIRIRDNPTAIVVPKDSMQLDRDKSVVFVQTADRRFRMVTVRRGICTEDDVEILGDIEPGTTIVRQGSHVLKSQVLLARMASAEL